MEKIIAFDAVLKAVEGNQAMSVDFPFDVFELYGVRGQVKVKVTYDGVLYRGSMVKMGGDCHWLLVRKDIRKIIGKNPGDTVHVTVQRDTEERIVEAPEELKTLFEQHPEAKAYYDTLSYTHRKEYVQWINEAKRPETRQNRLLKTIEMLMSKTKR
ncbi:MAG TPA: YdeI/OmpD-associated family protein [Saprospiraceae bacterium]|nr:YdeI/OmpD-associated family protein [Saprospiraceae bacterium]